jgi:hypothetical protein
VDLESVAITTSRIGHPLLVKISYHPRWKAEGADGPYLVSPALMMVIPRQPMVRLVYSRRVSDFLGAGLTLAALVFGVWSMRRRRVSPQPAEATTTPVVATPMATPMTTDACDLPVPTRRWGGAVPAAVILALVASRFTVPDRAQAAAREASMLREKALSAQAAGRFADAAEYARHGASRAKGALRTELLCLRGESLSRDDRPEESRQAFQAVAVEGGGPCAEASRRRNGEE